MSLASVIARVEETIATSEVGSVLPALSRAVLWCEKNFELPYTKRKEELVVTEGIAPLRGSIIKFMWDGLTPLIPSDYPLDVQEKAATAYFWDGDVVSFNGTTTQVVAIYDTFTDLEDGHWLLVHAEDLLVAHAINYIGELLNDTDLLRTWQSKIAIENKVLEGMLLKGRNKRSVLQQFARAPGVVLQGPPGKTITGPQGDSIVGPAGADSTVPGPVGPTSTVPGPRGADSTVPGPAGQDSTVPGPAGADSVVPGPAGADSTVPGPAGADSDVPGPRGHSGGEGERGRPGFNGQNGADSTVPGPVGPVGPEGPGVKGNPKLQTRTLQAQATSAFPLTPEVYTVSVDGDTTALRIGFPASEEQLVFNLRADVREVNLYREGEPQTRVEIDLNAKYSVVHQLVPGDPTSEIRFLEVSAPTADFATWLSTPGEATFYVQGELNPTELLDTEEASAQARISALNDTTFLLRFNRDDARLGAGKNGSVRANRWIGNRNLIYQPSDDVYARIVEAVGEGRLDSITVRANALGDSNRNVNLSAVARTATYPIDNLTFLSDAERLTNGNRIDIRLRDIVDPTWLNQAQTRFFVLSFNVLTPQLSDNFASYRYLRVSRNMASAVDRVANVGAGGINLDGTDTGGGVIFSANPEEQDALIAENFVLGDFVELIGHTSDDVSIPGAYLKWDNFTLTLLPDEGQARVVSPSSLPRAFLDNDLDKISIRLFPGSAASHRAAIQSKIQAESPFEFAWVVKKTGVDPVRNAKEIRWGFNSLKFSKEGNRASILASTHFEPGDDITLTPFDFAGDDNDNYSIIVRNWNFFDASSNTDFFEIGRTGNERPFNDLRIRAAEILKVTFHPGSKKLREQDLLINESGLFYQGTRIPQVPTATITGIFPNAVNRTITHTIHDYARTRIEEENLGAGDLMELVAWNANFSRTRREFKHLASPPTFSGGNIQLVFSDDDPILNLEFSRAAKIQVKLVKVPQPLETFRTTTTIKTPIANGDADTPGTYGFFNPANFGADDINRVMQLIEPISELGVYQTELENINRVEFRTEGATPMIYEFVRAPFITNSSGPDGEVTYIQFFFATVIAAEFRNATGVVSLTFLGEEDLRARNEITALTTRVDTNQSSIATNALAIAANVTAIANSSGSGTTDNVAHIFARSDVLHIVARKSDTLPSATNQTIIIGSTSLAWYANPNDRAIVLGLGFVAGDTFIVEGRDANNVPIESVACTTINGIDDSGTNLLLQCDSGAFSTAIRNATYISLTLRPSPIIQPWKLQRQWGGVGGEVWTGGHQNAGVEIGYDAEAVRWNILEVEISSSIGRSSPAVWLPETGTTPRFVSENNASFYTLRMRPNVGTSPLTKNRVSFSNRANAAIIYRLYSRN